MSALCIGRSDPTSDPLLSSIIDLTLPAVSFELFIYHVPAPLLPSHRILAYCPSRNPIAYRERSSHP
eukprot:m.63083 g.63083  ORF g.63083 m.63083 type:complete len:67 (+) comp7434_c0_seq3:1788-1988(+)